jgi:preprotein translocase subunit SecD
MRSGVLVVRFASSPRSSSAVSISGGAIESGFQKAFRTILDANVTNAAAAIVLMLYGTGPIKGFAVTLMIGIVTTLFTAVFVCKLVFDVYLRILENRGPRGSQTLSI